ncbi:MAG: hypothetical protein ACRD1R_08080 [Acidobacteriota bacterium]
MSKSKSSRKPPLPKGHFRVVSSCDLTVRTQAFTYAFKAGVAQDIPEEHWPDLPAQYLTRGK